MKIYADNAATTKLDRDAFEAMMPYLIEEYGNPSGAYSFAKKARKALKEARQTIAECINAEPEQIIFTSGGTESNNHAIKYFTVPSEICRVVTSAIEHHSVLYACENSGFEQIILSVDKFGMVSIDELDKVLEHYNTVSTSSVSTIVSIMTANNEIGTIQHIKELSEVAHRCGAVFHTDAVQAVGHIPIDVIAMGIDMLSASAHKFNGPKGIGFLYNNNSSLQTFHNGGTQESGMRAGTENVPAIVGMAVALKKNIEEMNHNMKHLQHLTDVFITLLNRAGINYIHNGHSTERLPGNVNISIKGKSGEGIMHILDLKGICISTGSACDSLNQQVSHVINAIGVSSEYREGTIRVTFGKYNTEQDVIDVANALIEIIGFLGIM